MRFGFATYIWQTSSDSYAGRVGHIADIVSECGCEGIESELCMLADYTDDPAELQELLESKSIRLAAICYVEDWLHDGETDEEAGRAAKAIDYVSRFPGSLLQLCPRSGTDRSNLRERQNSAIRCINGVARRAADKGIVCTVHPNSPPGSVFRTPDEYAMLLDGLDSSAVGLTPDTGHIARGAMHPLDIMHTYRSLVRHVHFKDVSAVGEWAGLGEGAVDFPAIVSYLADIQYEGWVIVEDESVLALADPDQAARRGAAYIRDHLLTLAP